jgi:cell division protein ZapA (FtsZ GTPase activity inhibitor)
VATAPEQAEALRELADRLDPKVRQKPLADMPDTDASAAATELREVAALLDRIWAGGNPEAAEANAP